jgi:hypothetical protein
VNTIALPAELTSNFAVSVPEPGTIALCLGLAAMVGFGYSRRQLKNEKAVPVEEVCVDAPANVHETVSN